MRIALFGGYAPSLVNFRGALIRALVLGGHEVLALAPAETGNIDDQISALGARFVPVSLNRAGMNVWQDWGSIRGLRATFERERPDAMLAYTIKPIVYGVPAARSAGVPHIFALVTGLGAAFHGTGIKGWLLRFIAVRLYRRALSRCKKVFVQNREIKDLFVRARIVAADKVLIVAGSGVDIRHFSFSPLPEGPPVFLYLGRLLRDKGVGEFVAAARRVKARQPRARFVLVGETDSNPASFSRAEVESWQREGVVEWLGFQADVRPYLHACTVYVLPSYHEGLPRSVLEAMATGRPIITSDAVGCRETVFNPVACDDVGVGIKRGRNGFLIPVRSVRRLATVMERLAADPSMAVAMGRESRTIAENFFDVHLVNDLMLTGMNFGPVVLPAPVA